MNIQKNENKTKLIKTNMKQISIFNVINIQVCYMQIYSKFLFIIEILMKIWTALMHPSKTTKNCKK